VTSQQATSLPPLSRLSACIRAISLVVRDISKYIPVVGNISCISPTTGKYEKYSPVVSFDARRQSGKYITSL